MATARQDSEWNHTSSLIATICNVNRGKGQAPIKAEDIHPSKAKPAKKGIPLKRENIGILKAFAQT